MDGDLNSNGHRPTHTPLNGQETRGDFTDAEAMALGKAIFSPSFATKYGTLLDPALFQSSMGKQFAAAIRVALMATGEVSPFLLIGDVAPRLDLPKKQVSQIVTNDLGEMALTFPDSHAVQALDRLREQRRRLDAETRLIDLVQCDDHGRRGLDGLRTSEIVEQLDAIAGDARHGVVTAPSLTLADTMTSDPCEDEAERIPTGLDFFDRAMPGGSLVRGDIVGIAGAPGFGKTALALEATLGTLSTNPSVHVVWGMAEMAEKQLRNRALSCVSGLPVGALRRPWEQLSPIQVKKKRAAMDALRDIGQRFHIVKAPVTPRGIEAAVVATGATWVVVDYLQIVQPDTAGANRRDDIDNSLREFLRITQEHGIVLILLSNMPKGDGSRRRDVYSAFKESSEVAHAVDLAFVGEWTGDDPDIGDDPPDVVDVRWRCLKSRNGAIESIVARFDRSVQQFRGLHA